LKYREELHKQFEYHRFLLRLEVLRTEATTGTWTPEHVEEYQRIDTTITEPMLRAEEQVGRRYTGT
jgi:hypothetical protein